MSTTLLSKEPSFLSTKRSLWRDAMRSFLKNRLAIFGLVVIVFFIFLAVFADLIAPTPYYKSVLSDNLKPPSLQHWMGTDAVGRDLLSRIIYGARTSLTVGFAVQLIAFGVGLPLGALAGLRGGWVDFIVTRILEVMTAFPGFLFAIFIMSILGTGLPNVILAIGIVSWIPVCRLTRGQLLALREREFVVSARSYGATDARIVLRHLLPHALPSLLIMLALGIPSAIFAEAGLSFLGVGINDPIPSWGKMVSESLGYIRVYWYLGIFPTLTIALAMFGFNFLGDGLRDALDPTMYNQ
ncbi:MAG: ABC transporter permease [Anaerolineaceae bacterium]|nr:ABC transporter permease [Anaerolineaceae bacterium]